MPQEIQKRFNELLKISRELSSNKPLPELFQGVIDIICASTGADGGTLYMYDSRQDTLKAVLLTNLSLGINSVVTEFDPLAISGFIEVPLSQNANCKSAKVSAAAFLEQRMVLIEDVVKDNEFDLAGVRTFDKENNYATQSIIAFPLNANNVQVGVLQVINPEKKCFAPDYLEFLAALSGQIAIALNNAVLIKEGENLLSAIVQMIGMAIDEKSPHTAGHCYRVTELTMMLADAVGRENNAPFADFKLSYIEREELRMAALLHDVGKVITPTHILEKRTKLYSLTDRVELLIDRFHMWQVGRELETLKKLVREAGREDLLQEAASSGGHSEEDIKFINEVNQGLIPMVPQNIERLKEIANRSIHVPKEKSSEENIILRDDLSNLETMRGTLNPDERKIMEDHVNSSIRLLSSIPWPRKFSRLVEYAGHHHEKMNGTGYPNKVSAEEMSIPARILGIADRFEGISAPDRPYRSRKMTMSQVLKIMTSMSQDGEIDPDLFGVFMRNKIYLEYGREYMDEALLDCD